MLTKSGCICESCLLAITCFFLPRDFDMSTQLKLSVITSKTALLCKNLLAVSDKKTTLKDAFRHADTVLQEGVRGAGRTLKGQVKGLTLPSVKGPQVKGLTG
jgi:hypothetical protein